MMDLSSLVFALFGHFLASFLYVLRKLHLVQIAAVDSSSILEHREELRDLWEKRMMADDQSSSSSVPKPKAEVDTEEAVTPETNSDASSPAKNDDNPHKMSNGFLKTGDDTMTSPDKRDVDLENNNNSADSLDEDEEEQSTNDKPEHVIKEPESREVLPPVVDAKVTEESPEPQEKLVELLEEEPVSTEPGIEQPKGQAETLVMPVEKEGTESSDEVHQQDEEETEAEGQQLNTPEKAAESSTEPISAEETVKDVPVDVQVLDEDVEAKFIDDAAVEGDIPWEKVDFSDSLEGEEVLEDTTVKSPTDDKPTTEPLPNKPLPDEKSRMEELVNGDLKRILSSGVQKTEQPYSSCTTETKIAMEIREMREREEELRVMRENALVSPQPPVGSPLPPVCATIRTPSPSLKDLPGPGYRVSSVFGHKGSTPSPPPVVEDEKKSSRGFEKESAVEKEIRLARDREEELRKQQGLPPREDDSYVKPSQVKSSQARVFGKMNSSPKQAATAKIQLEIEEQTQREMALRSTGHIQTISQERTDSKVAKLRELNILIPEINNTNGDYHSLSNGHSSPDSNYPKRSSPSPTGPRSLPATNGKGISMQKFIATRGRETTFSAPKVNGVVRGEEGKSAVPPTTVKLKRNLSVESKIQQEIVEMKQREEELRKLHMNRKNENFSLENNNNTGELELVMNQKNNIEDYENGYNEEEISPRHNKLIAQWEQRIQKAES